MSEFDVRFKTEETTAIRFSSDMCGNTYVASRIIKNNKHSDRVEVTDNTYDYDNEAIGYVVIPNKENALNLIKAIQKAIELEWLT